MYGCIMFLPKVVCYLTIPELGVSYLLVSCWSWSPPPKKKKTLQAIIEILVLKP